MEDGINLTCLVNGCGKHCKIISWKHLWAIHGMTMADYKKRFPNACLVSDDVRKQISRNMTGEKGSMYGVHRYGDKNPNYGKVHPSQSQKLRAKWRDNTSIYNSEEYRHKLAISISRAGNPINSEQSKEKRAEILKRRYRSGELVVWNKNLTEDKDVRVKRYAEKRRALVATGNMIVPHGAGRGTKIRFECHNKKYLLRSSYELVVAIYFYLRGWSINYEDRSINYKGHNYLSDFRFGKKIYEVKGYIDKRAELSKEAFTIAGYKYTFIFRSKILSMKRYIISKGIEINSVVNDALESYREKKIYLYRIGG
jgi:hypothetical protein